MDVEHFNKMYQNSEIEAKADNLVIDSCFKKKLSKKNMTN